MNDKTIPHDNQTPETEKRSADLNPTLRTKGKPSCTTTTPARKPNYPEKLTPRQISYHLESPKHAHQNESTKGRENTISKHPSKPPTPTSDSHLDTPPPLPHSTTQLSVLPIIIKPRTVECHCKFSLPHGNCMSSNNLGPSHPNYPHEGEIHLHHTDPQLRKDIPHYTKGNCTPENSEKH